MLQIVVAKNQEKRVWLFHLPSTCAKDFDMYFNLFWSSAGWVLGIDKRMTWSFIKMIRLNEYDLIKQLVVSSRKYWFCCIFKCNQKKLVKRAESILRKLTNAATLSYRSVKLFIVFSLNKKKA